MSRLLERTVTVDASVPEVWEAWTTNDGVRTFLAPAAHVELRPGGPFEMYFAPDAPAGSRGSDGCIVLSFDAPERLTFSWNFPPSLGEIRDERTEVTVTLESDGPTRTRVELRQSGWKDGAIWDEGFAYFGKAWAMVLGRLRVRFDDGPIDWDDPPGFEDVTPL